MRGFVTVFTDASWCPDLKVYGWAVWVKHGDGETIRWWGGGYAMETSQAAEMKALEKAISILIASEEVDLEDKIVVIQSDCQNGLHLLDTSPLEQAGVKFVKKKHVKGHRGYSCKRSSVNTWCDKTARREMKKHRGRINPKKRSHPEVS